MHLLDQEILKSEPLEIPLKKSKLDEYAAYLYAAAMDPLYIHAAMYEQWSTRQMSAFRPVPTIFAKESKTRHSVPTNLGRYKEPPVLQNPERVVPMSESERFERTYQPNVALAPPKKHKYKDEIKIEYPKIEDFPKTEERIENTVITKPEDRTHSVVDSTVSVVQTAQRYNPEIELSTDTDDSLSDTSGDNHKVSDVQRVAEALLQAPEEMKERVLDLVRNIAKEHIEALQKCQEKDDKIRQLEQRIRELEEKQDDTGSRSEYDVSSSREMPVEEAIEETQSISEEPTEVSSTPEEISSKETVILAISPSTIDKIDEAIKTD